MKKTVISAFACLAAASSAMGAPQSVAANTGGDETYLPLCTEDKVWNYKLKSDGKELLKSVRLSGITEIGGKTYHNCYVFDSGTNFDPATLTPEAFIREENRKVYMLRRSFEYSDISQFVYGLPDKEVLIYDFSLDRDRAYQIGEEEMYTDPDCKLFMTKDKDGTWIERPVQVASEMLTKSLYGIRLINECWNADVSGVSRRIQQIADANVDSLYTMSDGLIYEGLGLVYYDCSMGGCHVGCGFFFAPTLLNYQSSSVPATTKYWINIVNVEDLDGKELFSPADIKEHKSVFYNSTE